MLYIRQTPKSPRLKNLSHITGELTAKIYSEELLLLQMIYETSKYFCLSVDGFRAVVERHLEVEVTGFNRNGSPIKVDATGWQARILQHECDHLDGTIYVDKFVPRTFRTVENLDLPLPIGSPQLGVCKL